MLFKLIVFGLLAVTIMVAVVLYMKAAALEKEIMAESRADRDETHEDDDPSAVHEEGLDREPLARNEDI